MMASLAVGLAATKEPWSAGFRSYVRDHSQGVGIEVLMDRAALRRALPRIDVLVLDDVMRIFSQSDVSRARDGGVHVVGLFDHSAGMGRQYLVTLGVDQVATASTPPAELLALISRVQPRPKTRMGPAGWSPGPGDGQRGGAARKGKGTISAWTKVSGGAGLSEAVVTAAEVLSKSSRALLIEAEEVSPVLVSRLLRNPEGGLPWALSRARQGLRALPEGLSGPRGDGTAPIGHFDVVCAAPGTAQVIGAAQLERLVLEAAECYDHVLVETSALAGPPSTGDQFSAARVVLRGAGLIVIMAAADPDGAARLVQWRASALAAGVEAPCWAVFGRARKSRYENEHLRAVVEANTGRYPFAGFSYLPEDPTVQRARWNAEIAWKGPWLSALGDLVASSLVLARSQVAGGGRAPEPGTHIHPTDNKASGKPERVVAL
jgi:hypothetical protein